MRRFGFDMDDNLYNSFYSIFPDYGRRSNILRRCVKRIVEMAKVTGGILPGEIDAVADEAADKERSILR